ncbi:MAG: hypothetical protein KAQ65_11220, partial [Candidatus Thorarchaeota archaeon]|nr:hypothetical protein [Candidatus Thorarchaeota archaeon]
MRTTSGLIVLLFLSSLFLSVSGIMMASPASSEIDMTIDSVDPSYTLADSSFKWQDDCSNFTGWDRLSSFYSSPTSNGDYVSDGSSLSVTGIPSDSGWHGPAFQKQLPFDIPLTSEIIFSVDMAVSNTASSYMGHHTVYLLDEDGDIVFNSNVNDRWAASNDGAVWGYYKCKNGTWFRNGFGEEVHYTSFDGTIDMWVGPDGYVGSSVSGYGGGFLTYL